MTVLDGRHQANQPSRPEEENPVTPISVMYPAKTGRFPPIQQNAGRVIGCPRCPESEMKRMLGIGGAEEGAVVRIFRKVNFLVAFGLEIM